MNTKTKLKLFNDPIYGFITIPSEIIFQLINHPYFQRLRRISQMGLSYLVFSGAHHTRFNHAVGSMYLMQKTINVLRFKNVSISEEEEHSLLITILLHDIGHGPFSHALEDTIVHKVSHEEVSILFMEKLNKAFENKLDLAISIFTNSYHRKFMHQLISSQLDMDRIDYLKRDSFYTGVSEGNINAERLIAMLNVVNDQLVVEEKGVFSVESFLFARRLMYWQVYLHKTSLVAEQLLIRVFKRAKELIKNKIFVTASDSLLFFLNNTIKKTIFNDDVLERFSQLDDNDILFALKSWQSHDDFILSQLSKMIINRSLLKIKIKNNPITNKTIKKHRKLIINLYHINEEEASYFIFDGKISNQIYSKQSQRIKILYNDNTIKDIAEVSDHLRLNTIAKPITKYYICYPKEKL